MNNLELLDRLRRFPSTATVAEIIAVLEGLAEHGVCRWCAQPITTDGQGVWHHDDRYRSRGCRAASFDPATDNGWNDALPRQRKATPA